MPFSDLGFGLGLRPCHYQDLLALNSPSPVDWLEIITEDYLVAGGAGHHYLVQLAERYPIVMHGVSLSIGSTDPINEAYLQQVKTLSEQVGAAWISDHLCWTGTGGKNTHDLLPLPYTEEALTHLTERVQRVQDSLGQPILLENPSTYLTFNHSTITEWDFLQALADAADCYLLLDVNNVYVSAVNHDFDPAAYFSALSPKRVKQFHLAGHRDFGTHIIDTHDAPIIDAVWQWYQHAVARFPEVPTLLERDDNIPPLAELLEELAKARRLAAMAVAEECVNE